MFSSLRFRQLQAFHAPTPRLTEHGVALAGATVHLGVMASRTALQVLQQRFGFSAFRPGQEHVVESLLRPVVPGQRPSALAVFPTGAGKSLCYQLPALLLDGLTVVVSPLIALMKDQIDALTARGIAAARLDSSLSKEEHNDVVNRVRDGSLRLLYVAPERFANERFLAMLHKTKIALFAVDEAHSISEWGHNFRPDYLKLARIAVDVGAERVLALTATATPAVVDSICARFGINHKDVVVTGFYRSNLELRTTAVAHDDKDHALLAALTAAARGPTIVYVTLQKTAARVAALVASTGRTAEAYHAGLGSEHRADVQERFMASSDGVVVATIAFGMGIDKANVRTVLHYDLPKSLEGYSQEIGRAGRDGAPSVVHLLACPDDAGVLEGFACGDTPTREALRALVVDVLGRGERFDLDLGELGDDVDLRPLVLRTALTHLELDEIVQQGTPWYGVYKIEALVGVDEILKKFSTEKAAYIEAIFGFCKKGRTLLTLQLDTIVRAGHDRTRVVKALEFLAEQGLVTLQVSDLRHSFKRGPAATNINIDDVVAKLHARFALHERREIERLAAVLALVTADHCQTNHLVAHFGETRVSDCGHCSWCQTRTAVVLPPQRPTPDFARLLDPAAFGALVSAHPKALGLPRQQARFLCGLTSPATTKAKLSKHALMGALEQYRFDDVLAWRADSVGTST